MPVTITTAEHAPRKWKAHKVSTAEKLLKESSPKDYRRCQNIIQSSFSRSQFRQSHISASTNGFVWAVFHAYSSHHNLTIRPEDVWFSILTQLSFFVNAHAEELRPFFVAHEGQKQLEVIENGSMDYADFGALAVRMTKLIEKNVVDPDLRDWIMPSFSTTTESDTVVAAILMMGSLQKYFSYAMTLICGIPSVTLLGEREDWLSMVQKLEKLKQLGNEPARFAQLLRPILNHFVLCFDGPESSDVLSFWGRCAHKYNMGSGPDYLCGWISVFCFWDENGKMLRRDRIHPVSSAEFERQNTELCLDDALSRRVDIRDVPSGFASVPVTVNDNGEVYDTMMLAGLVGIQASSSGAVLDQGRDHLDSDNYGHQHLDSQPESGPDEETGLDSIQPLSGWWMYEKQHRENGERTSEEASIDPISGSQHVEDWLSENTFLKLSARRRREQEDSADSMVVSAV
ncbi:hypothetical protein UA08_07778 [Talaromyces atroroseus]|uniref:Uncharacterized protein n=1 Tax=Talaromyces atroroseus TaxID=1441469 RepID=A0A225AD01_TALAT|nr:hypothetical protein UA08_07778 [Talaromyces atroroseus]OKL56803.1 hypothetical protein UA08_07778 [Talaromyces atroroseus]